MHFPRHAITVALRFLVFSIFVVSPAAAQSVPSGTVEGTVVDPSGRSLLGLPWRFGTPSQDFGRRP